MTVMKFAYDLNNRINYIVVRNIRLCYFLEVADQLISTHKTHD